MMQRIWQFFTNTRVLAVIGFAALAAFLLFGADSLQITFIWVAVIFLSTLLIWCGFKLYQKWKANKSGEALGDMLEQQASKSTSKTDTHKKEEVEAIRSRMLGAISTIKKSKLGLMSGSSALYELPWYMIIGNPAAGKSTAIANSGLQFPYTDKGGKIIQGVGGTRNCDWFFTTDGILLDTAGRYSVYEEDREEWFGFLNLLKKHRKLAPINGIIIAVSITELTSNRPEFGINLAKNLRQRVQELTERLEVFAPVYIVFTKADLIAGFNEFFLDSERAEKDRVWGATSAYSLKNTNEDVLSFFDTKFDELYDGLKDVSLANMSMNRSEKMLPGVFTFPLEFASIKTPLRAFIATLFEENPFQFKPVFRGFYFTSALQEGTAVSASSERVADRFNLKLVRQERAEITSQHGFFLLELFRKVIFADKNLVSKYASRKKTQLRYATFFAATMLIGLSLAAWSWSYVSNRELVSHVQTDLDQAIKVQANKIDLQSRFEALDILQSRIEQLEKYHQNRPWSLRFGLYQGDLLERKLKEEYFSGVREVLLKPVAGNVENFLSDMNNNADKLEAMTKAPQSGAATLTEKTNENSSSPYRDASPSNTEDAYNALKTYLMLSDKSHAESSHLNDQLTRFWRGWLEINRGTMPREQMIRSAESLLSFYLSQVNDPSWPTIESKLSLVDQSRESLRRVVRGMPAKDRVYADVKARASTRYPAITVANIVGDKDKTLLAGSYAVSGTFTRDAWEGFIKEAFKDAANKELQSADWVLKTTAKDDLTLEGSPEQIQKVLVEQYKTEYAQEWQKFIQGINVTDLNGFDGAVAAMNRFGDPQTSPINKLISTVYEQTSWDNPSLVNEGLKKAQSGVIGWFKESILRQSPSRLDVDVKLSANSTEIPVGPVGKEFSGIAKLIVAKDKDQNLMSAYLASLSKLRSRFNQLKNQGDTGPGAKQLMQQTLEGSSSELAESLKFVDEQMLTGMTDEQKLSIRPLLVRPLMQTFNVIIKPTETELNKIWAAQVYEPFQRNIANKYPFSADAKIEASSAEIAQIFGTDGAIAKFVNTSMGPLIVRRGDALTARTWANMGITLSPVLISNFSTWIASAGGSGTEAGAAAGAVEPQWVFQILPTPAAGTVEYSIEIDGQVVRYRNTQSQWANLVWPAATAAPGARISAVMFDGRTVEIANFPGKFGFNRFISAAQYKKNDNGTFTLTWTNGTTKIPVELKIISKAEPVAAGGGAAATPQGQGLRGTKLPETIAGGAVVLAENGAPISTTAANTATTANTVNHATATEGAQQ